MPDVDVVHKHGTVERLVRVLSERLKLLGDIGDPAFGDPTHSAHRGRMVGVSKEGDFSAVRFADDCAPVSDTFTEDLRTARAQL